MNSSGQYPDISQDGLPHSEIHGSKPVCGSPWLIATYYVLHRLLAPRHPPYALSSLITKRTAFDLPSQILAALSELYLPLIELPMCSFQRTSDCSESICILVVGLTGLEPVTLRLSSACSNQLSYRPDKPLFRGFYGRCGSYLVELRRFELLTYSLQSYRSTN